MPTPSSPVTIEQLQGWADDSPFIAFCQMTVESLDAERGIVEMKMPLIDALSRGGAHRMFHGGPVASLIDTAGDFAVAAMVGGGVPTMNFRVDYLRPSSGAYLIARATARRVGRTVGVADVDVFDDQGRLTAIGRGCYSAIPG